MWRQVRTSAHRQPGRCRVRLSTDSLDWAAFALLTVACDFEEVSPPALGAHLQGWAERIGRAIA
jgi:predicted DNA-binding transcriptional regulator YafY